MSCNLKGTNLIRANRLIPIIVSVILLAVGIGSDIGDLNTDAPALKSGQPSLEKAMTMTVAPQAPVITSVDLTSEAVPEGTKITVTVRAESNSPVNWINNSFYGPHGNIYGGGNDASFTEVSPGLWEYTWRDIVSKYAPSGTYYYENISVRNAGMLSSDVWSYPLTKEIINAADTGILLLGDINEDGKINVSDAILILRHIVGLTTLVGNELIAADVNHDFEINVSDAILILRYIVGLVPSL